MLYHSSHWRSFALLLAMGSLACSSDDSTAQTPTSTGTTTSSTGQGGAGGGSSTTSTTSAGGSSGGSSTIGVGGSPTGAGGSMGGDAGSGGIGGSAGASGAGGAPSKAAISDICYDGANEDIVAELVQAALRRAVARRAGSLVIDVLDARVEAREVEGGPFLPRHVFP